MLGLEGLGTSLQQHIRLHVLDIILAYIISYFKYNVKNVPFHLNTHTHTHTHTHTLSHITHHYHYCTHTSTFHYHYTHIIDKQHYGEQDQVQSATNAVKWRSSGTIITGAIVIIGVIALFVIVSYDNAF